MFYTIDSSLEANPEIVCEGLVVKFPQFQLGPIDLTAYRGQTVILAGANGSGKTTLLRSICGLQPREDGMITVAGDSVRGRTPWVLRNVGWVPDDQHEILLDLTAEELWWLHISAHRCWGADQEKLWRRANTLARLLDFRPPQQRISTYSHGMRKKTQVVAGLLHDPSIVLIDEPLNGLDPTAAGRLEDLLAGMRDKGATVIMSTHDLRLAQRVGNRVAILRCGSLVTEIAPSSLVCQDSARVVTEILQEIG